MPTSSPSPPLPAQRQAQSYREHGPRQREPRDLVTIAGSGRWEEAGQMSSSPSSFELA